MAGMKIGCGAAVLAEDVLRSRPLLALGAAAARRGEDS